jgi:hypothetical protein
MPKNCFGIQDTQTGLWLTGYNPAVENSTWGNEQDAVCFSTEQLRDEALAALNGETSRFVGGNPRPR